MSEEPQSVELNEETMLQMSPWDFDQSPQGWRSLVHSIDPDTGHYHEKPGGRLKAVVAIRKYLEVNQDKFASQPKQKELRPGIMYFHIGQMLAFEDAKYYEEAVESFKKSFHENQDDPWNAYVRATIAFLEGNIDEIDRSIEFIEAYPDEPRKMGGNIKFVKNFKKALLEGNKKYNYAYSLPQD